MLSRRDFLKSFIATISALGIPIEFDLSGIPDTPITREEPGVLLKFGQGLHKITSISYERELIEYPNWTTMTREYKSTGGWSATFEGCHDKVYDFPPLGEMNEFEVKVPGLTKWRLNGTGYLESWSEEFTPDGWLQYTFTIVGHEPLQWELS